MFKALKYRAMCLLGKFVRLRFTSRLLIKLGLFSIVVFIAHFPNAALFIKQVNHILKMEQLIQPDFPGIIEINDEIDRRLPQRASRIDEFHIVESYVYEKIAYDFDWNIWSNADYWPTATEVWNKRREDCDGQAVLAASILRSRGFDTATIAGDIMHVWVVVDSDELMSPGENTNFKSTDGKLSLALPTSALLINGVSFYFGNFPLTRLLVMLLAAILLGFHPSKNAALLFGTTTLGLIGLLLLKDSSSQPNFVRFGVVVGSIFLCSSVILAPVASKIARKMSIGDAAAEDCKSTTGEMSTD